MKKIKNKYDRRRAVDCKLERKSNSNPGYFKYNVTIREKDGTVHTEPCYGKDLTCTYNSDTILFHQHKSLWIENLDSKYALINLDLNIFFSLFADSLSFYYFIFFRGYKILYFIILIYIYYSNQK